MKKPKLIIVCILITISLSFAIISSKIPKHVEAEFYSEEEINIIKSLVKSSPVVAVINKNCSIYSEDNEKSSIVAETEKGEEAEIIKDKSTLWYKVKLGSNKNIGWIKGENLDIPKDPETNNLEMKEKYIEGFINIMEFESNTEYFVWTDIDRQLTHIFRGEKKNWKLIKTFKCATGKNISPTTRGFFKTSDKGEWFYSERLGSGAKYWTRFNGSYLFHSIAMDKNQNIIDDVLGERRSSGCVRMSLRDIKWFYDKIPSNTSIFIN